MGRAALEQAYANLSKLSNKCIVYIYISKQKRILKYK